MDDFEAELLAFECSAAAAPQPRPPPPPATTESQRARPPLPLPTAHSGAHRHGEEERPKHRKILRDEAAEIPTSRTSADSSRTAPVKRLPPPLSSPHDGSALDTGDVLRRVRYGDRGQEGHSRRQELTRPPSDRDDDDEEEEAAEEKDDRNDVADDRGQAKRPLKALELPPLAPLEAAGGGGAASPVAQVAQELYTIDAAGSMFCTGGGDGGGHGRGERGGDRSVPEAPLGATLNSYIARCLRPYQRHGVAWIHRRLREAGGCVLGDDMGEMSDDDGVKGKPKSVTHLFPKGCKSHPPPHPPPHPVQALERPSSSLLSWLASSARRASRWMMTSTTAACSGCRFLLRRLLPLPAAVAGACSSRTAYRSSSSCQKQLSATGFESLQRGAGSLSSVSVAAPQSATL
jgi:hypothetical protein